MVCGLDSIPLPQAHAIVAEGYRGLSPEQQAQFDTLFNAQPALGRVGIFSTNALPLGDTVCDDPETRSAVFLQISRINHSCAPNVQHSYCEVPPHNLTSHLTLPHATVLHSVLTSPHPTSATGLERIYAVKRISEGEQLFTSYIDSIYMDYAQRQSALKEKFGFICRCSVCEVQGKTLKRE